MPAQRVESKEKIESLLLFERDSQDKRLITVKVSDSGPCEGMRMSNTSRDADGVRHFHLRIIQSSFSIDPTLAEIEWVEVYS